MAAAESMQPTSLNKTTPTTFRDRQEHRREVNCIALAHGQKGCKCHIRFIENSIKISDNAIFIKPTCNEKIIIFPRPPSPHHPFDLQVLLNGYSCSVCHQQISECIFQVGGSRRHKKLIELVQICGGGCGHG